MPKLIRKTSINGRLKFTDIWSYGGGTQSIAILLMIRKGLFKKPDMALMVDTGREGTWTWDYHYHWVVGIMEEIGLDFRIIQQDKEEPDLYSSGSERLLIPAFREEGTKMMNFCTGEWKVKVFRQYLRILGYGGRRPVRCWLGISFDELERMRETGLHWIQNIYPLIDEEKGIRMTREDCVKLILDEGLPSPPRSSCWMCPHKSDEEWKGMKKDWEEDWRRAVKLDKEIRSREEEEGRGKIYLHRSRIELENIDFTSLRAGARDICEGGYCFV